MRKGQKTCYDYGIKVMLRLAGGNESTKKDSKVNVLFCIGLNTRTGLPTMHSAFERRFVIRVRATTIFSLYIL